MSRAELTLEAGGSRTSTISPVRGRRVPAISEPGYHRLLIDDREIVAGGRAEALLTFDDAVPDARLWGLAAQVYSLRHPGDGGIGDARRCSPTGRRGARARMRWR